MSINIRIFHTSDEHGQIKNAAAIRQIVNDGAKENPGGTLFLSGGDFFEGSLTSKLLGTQPSEEVLHASRYDAIAFGNHDTDRGEAYSRKWIDQSPCPVLAANLTDRRTGHMLDGVKPYQIFETNGVKVGVIGLATPETLTIELPSMVGNLGFDDPVATTKRCVDELKAQGADVIGVLAHLGLPAEKELAAAVPGLDFILGGHTHEPTEHPEIVNGTPIAHPGAMRTSVGRLDIAVDEKTKRPISTSFELIPIKGDEPKDEAVASIVSKWEDRVKAQSEETVAQLEDDLEHHDSQPDRLDAVVGEAMRDTGAEVALVNQQFTRTRLPAHVRLGDLMSAMPFDNRLATMKMKVGEVLRVVRESMRRGDDSSLFLSGSFQMSTDDRALTLLNDEKVLPDDAEVTVATTDYLLSGGLGYFPADTVHGSTDGGILRDVVATRLKKMSR